LKDVTLNDLRNVEELIGGPIILNDNELITYMFGMLVLNYMTEKEKNSSNRFKKTLIDLLSAPKTLELLMVAAILGVRNISFRKLIR